MWRCPFTADFDRFDYTKNANLPGELTSDRDISLVYFVNIYWFACILIDTTAGFIQLVESTRGEQNADVQRRHETGGKIEEATMLESERQALEMSVLQASTPYAYKIAYSAHWLFGPRVGSCIYSMSIVPISLALSLLTAFEPAREASAERQRLGYLFINHTLSGWVTEFAEATDDTVPKEELSKARRIRWWTRGLCQPE